MKLKITSGVILGLLLPFLITAQEQGLTDMLNQLTEHIQTVESKKFSYDQTFSYDKDLPYKVRFETTKTDSKGKSVGLIQELNLKDIDPLTIKRDKVKDLLTVRAFIDGKNKYIKNFNEEGEQQKYSNRIEIIANDIDNAKEIEAHLKKIIPLAQKIESPDQAPSDYNEAINWLVEKIVDAEKGGKPIRQSISKEAKNHNRLTFESETDGKKETTTLQWSFNLMDLNDRRIAMKVDGKNGYVQVETKSKNNYIRHHKNSALSNYQKSFKIYTSDIETGKMIANTFSQLATTARERHKDESKKSVALLNEIIKNSEKSDNGSQIDIEGQCKLEFSYSYNKKDKSINERLSFNLADLDPRSTTIDVSKKTVWVKTKTLKKEKLIHVTKDGEQQNYTDGWSIPASGIEQARALLTAIPMAIKNCEGNNECQTSSSETPSQLSAKVIELISNVNNIQQMIEPSEDNPNQWHFTRIEEKKKGPKENTWIFNLDDLDNKSFKIEVSKKTVSLILQTKQKEEIIKYYENQTPQDYKNKMEWLCPNIETARAIICALEKVISK